jgi:hypothetical protein
MSSLLLKDVVKIIKLLLNLGLKNHLQLFFRVPPYATMAMFMLPVWQQVQEIVIKHCLSVKF